MLFPITEAECPPFWKNLIIWFTFHVLHERLSICVYASFHNGLRERCGTNQFLTIACLFTFHCNSMTGLAFSIKTWYTIGFRQNIFTPFLFTTIHLQVVSGVGENLAFVFSIKYACTYFLLYVKIYNTFIAYIYFV